MRLLPASAKIKHVIRPDGTIRIATSAPIQVEEGEVVVLEDSLRQPGRWHYDTKLKKLVELTSAQVALRKDARERGAKGERKGLELKRKRLLKLIGDQPADIAEALRLLAELSGVAL